MTRAAGKAASVPATPEMNTTPPQASLKAALKIGGGNARERALTRIHKRRFPNRISPTTQTGDPRATRFEQYRQRILTSIGDRYDQARLLRRVVIDR